MLIYVAFAQINLAYATLKNRTASTPIFYARPMDSDPDLIVNRLLRSMYIPYKVHTPLWSRIQLKDGEESALPPCAVAKRGLRPQLR